MLKFFIIIHLLFLFNSNLFCQENKLVKNYYNNKALLSVGYMKDNLMQGRWLFYYQTGHLQSIEYFNKDKKTGKFYEYYENGKVKTIGTYDSNCTVSISKKDTLDDGQISDIILEYSCRIGVWRFYKIDGTCVTKEFEW